MGKKWTNRNLAGALHFVTGNVHERRRIFTFEDAVREFYEELQELKSKMEAKLIAHVVMPDHIHVVVNPRDGDIQTWTGNLKGLSAKRIVPLFPENYFEIAEGENQVWQESFKSLPLWSPWMIWQKINYIHNNPVRAGLARSARDYPWTSFRSFYKLETNPLLAVDEDWFYEDDDAKLRQSMSEWHEEIIAKNEDLKRRLVGKGKVRPVKD